jgi:hypothetical protein
MHQGLRGIDKFKIVTGCNPALLATTAGDGDYVSMKNYDRCTMILTILNATTVTGGAVTLLQASDVAGTGAKALAFTTMWANTDTAASDTLVETAVTSNTFTTSATNSKALKYVIEVQASDLDVAGGFDCVRIDVASSVASVGNVEYILHEPRYASPIAISAITD